MEDLPSLIQKLGCMLLASWLQLHKRSRPSNASNPQIFFEIAEFCGWLWFNEKMGVIIPQSHDPIATYLVYGNIRIFLPFGCHVFL